MIAWVILLAIVPRTHCGGLIVFGGKCAEPGLITSKCMAFCVATRPTCSEQFRLVWRIGKRLPPSTVIRLGVPGVRHGSEQVAVQLVVFGAGREQFPNSVVVEKSAILAEGR